MIYKYLCVQESYGDKQYVNQINVKTLNSQNLISAFEGINKMK